MFVTRAEEDKVRVVQEDIYVLMKRSGAEMKKSVEAAAKEARAVFTKALNTTAEEAISKIRAKSELRRRRDVKEAARVAEDDDFRRMAQEED